MFQHRLWPHHEVPHAFLLVKRVPKLFPPTRPELWHHQGHLTPSSHAFDHRWPRIPQWYHSRSLQTHLRTSFPPIRRVQQRDFYNWRRSLTQTECEECQVAWHQDLRVQHRNLLHEKQGCFQHRSESRRPRACRKHQTRVLIATQRLTWRSVHLPTTKRQNRTFHSRVHRER